MEGYTRPVTALLDSDRLPPLPRALGELMRLLQAEDSSPKEIAAKIALEPASTVRVLKMANSPYFGGRGRVSTVSHAVLLIGLEALKSILIAVETPAAFGAPAGIDVKAFWRQSFATAALCQWAVRRGATSPANYETAFTVGLLSGIGALVLAEPYRSDSAAVKQASGELAAHWRLPVEVVGAIRGAAEPGDPYAAALELAVAGLTDLPGALDALRGSAASGLDADLLAERIDEAQRAVEGVRELVD